MEITIHATFSRFPKCLNEGFDYSRVKCPQCQDWEIKDIRQLQQGEEEKADPCLHSRADTNAWLEDQSQEPSGQGRLMRVKRRGDTSKPLSKISAALAKPTAAAPISCLSVYQLLIVSCSLDGVTHYQLRAQCVTWDSQSSKQ